jgi:hypothetical protein
MIEGVCYSVIHNFVDLVWICTIELDKKKVLQSINSVPMVGRGNYNKVRRFVLSFSSTKMGRAEPSLKGISRWCEEGTVD